MDKNIDYMLGEEYRDKYELYVDTQREKLIPQLVDHLHDYSLPEDWYDVLTQVITMLVTNAAPGTLTTAMNELELVKTYEHWVEDYLSG